MKIRVILADDERIIRESLRILLAIDEEIEVVETFDNGEDAYKFTLNNEVDVALLDIRMPKGDGVTATKEIIESTSCKVIILTTFDEDEYIEKALEYGANGYLLKNTNPEEIIGAIKVVYNGNSVLQNDILNKVKGKKIFKEDMEISNDNLTDREKEIVKNISKGLNNKQIAKELFITEGTVKNYISSILMKCKLEHRTQIAIAYLKGRDLDYFNNLISSLFR